MTGIVKEQVGAVVTVLTANEVLTLRAADIEKRTPSELSMMPDDVIKTLEEEGVEKFEASWTELVAGVKQELEAAKAAL